MVKANDRVKEVYVPGAFCPVCGEKFVLPRVTPSPAGSCGRQIRQVFGWCFQCDRGLAMIQFASGDSWLTHEYQEYTLDENDKPVLAGKWVKVFAMPEPAPVVVGCGGDFYRPVNLDPKVEAALKTSTGILNKAGKAVIDLMDIAKGERS